MPETPLFVHVITLAFGLMIAFGLQQVVALFQRRRRQRLAQKQAAIAEQQTPPSASTPRA
jgi:Flp pilus assembly protein protease CpaA